MLQDLDLVEDRVPRACLAVETVGQRRAACGLGHETNLDTKNNKTETNLIECYNNVVQEVIMS